MGTDLQHISENFRQLQVDAHCPVPHLLFLPCLGTSNLLQFSWINWLSEHMKHHLQPYKKNLHNNLHIRRSPSSARSCISGLVRAKTLLYAEFCLVPRCGRSKSSLLEIERVAEGGGSGGQDEASARGGGRAAAPPPPLVSTRRGRLGITIKTIY